MNGCCFNLLSRQDLQDYLDILYSRFPEETGNSKSASLKIRLPLPNTLFIFIPYK